MEKVKNMKKPAIAVLAVVLVLAVSVMGTLAYLTSKQDDKNTVVNTFIAAGGGNLIDPHPEEPDVTVSDNDPDKPVFREEDDEEDDEENPKLNKGFYLLESQVKYDDTTNNYVTTGYKTLKGNYDKVAPQMVLPKEPTLTVDIATGAEAYIFVKVIDTTKGNLDYTVDTTNWTEIKTSETLEKVEKLYCYKNAAQTGNAGKDIDAVPILAGNDKYESGMVTVADENTWKDINNNKEDGMQLGELKFEAYICQAQGFGSAAEAFAECFK